DRVPKLAEGKTFSLSQCRHDLDVRAGRTRSVSSTRDDDTSGRWIISNIVQHFQERMKLIGIKGMQRFRTIEENGRNAVRYFDVNRHASSRPHSFRAPLC